MEKKISCPSQINPYDKLVLDGKNNSYFDFIYTYIIYEYDEYVLWVGRCTESIFLSFLLQ